MVGYSVGISLGIGGGNLEGSPLGGKSIGADNEYGIGSSNGRSYGI